jgi:hypothetical protein
LGFSGSGGIYLRIGWQSTYFAWVSPSGSAYNDFIGNGSVTTTPTVYSYDWTCPTGSPVFYASLCVYCVGGSDLACQAVSCIPYAAAGQWGADVTGANQSATTSSIANQSLDTLPDGVTYVRPINVSTGGIYKVSSPFKHQGGIVQTISAGIFNATVTNTSISLWNTSESLPYPDGTFLTTPSTGSSAAPVFVFSGLTASTEYYLSAYYSYFTNQCAVVMSDV